MMRIAVAARSFSARDLPTPRPVAWRKVLAMPPPMTRASTLVTRFSSRSILRRDLGAADDGDERALGRLQALRQGVELGLHGAAGVGGQHAGEALRRGMRPVRRREGVVDVEIAERRQLLDEGRVVLLLARMEAGVLEEKHVAVLQGGRRLWRRPRRCSHRRRPRACRGALRPLPRQASGIPSGRVPSGVRNGREGSPFRPCPRSPGWWEGRARCASRPSPCRSPSGR